MNATHPRSATIALSLLASLGAAPATSAQCDPQTIFAAPISFPVGDGPVALAVGDFNADGNSDLVVANGDSDDISVLLGTPGLAFQPELRLEAGDDPTSVAIADLDNDGDADIAVTTGGDDAVIVFLGFGDGTFAEAIVGATLPSGATPQDLIAREFTGDAIVDIAVVLGQDDEIQVLPGNGDGTFAPPFFPGAVIETPSSTGASIPRSIITADLDGDLDDRDFAVPSDPAAWSFRNSNGTWTPVVAGETTDPSDVAAGDVNGDTITDLVLVKSDDVIVRFGVGDGTFEPGMTFFAPDPNRVVAVDLNGDGLDDIVTASDFDDVLAVLIADAKDIFLPAAEFDAGVDEFFPAPIDVDNDGDIDLAVTNNVGAVSILVNQCIVAPTVVRQPRSIAVDAGDAEAIFSVAVRGTAPVMFQWRRDGVDLVDGASVSGANTDTLRIANPTLVEAGVYDVVITNASGADVSDAAVLAFTNPEPADLNADGVVNAFDLADLLSSWGQVP